MTEITYIINSETSPWYEQTVTIVDVSTVHPGCVVVQLPDGSRLHIRPESLTLKAE
jgi:hypothetical protein